MFYSMKHHTSFCTFSISIWVQQKTTCNLSDLSVYIKVNPTIVSLEDKYSCRRCGELNIYLGHPPVGETPAFRESNLWLAMVILGHSLLELYYLLHSIAVLPTSNQCWTIQSINGIVIETIQLSMDKFKQDWHKTIRETSNKHSFQTGNATECLGKHKLICWSICLKMFAWCDVLPPCPTRTIASVISIDPNKTPPPRFPQRIPHAHHLYLIKTHVQNTRMSTHFFFWGGLESKITAYDTNVSIFFSLWKNLLLKHHEL